MPRNNQEPLDPGTFLLFIVLTFILGILAINNFKKTFKKMSYETSRQLQFIEEVPSRRSRLVLFYLDYSTQERT